MAEKINTKPFILHSDFKPSGDQPQAIEKLVENLEDGLAHQTLLGVTGSGKTFTIANVIATLNRPAMLLAPNKTLAAQLYAEMKAFFPENAVEYFVSYYDYYQPEAYVPSSDTFIEKDASINDQIEQMRLSATKSFLERRDTIVVASVSAIYGLGDPDSYLQMMLHLQQGAIIDQRQILAKLAELQYTRNDQAFQRGTFRVRGEVIDIFPAESDDRAVRIELFDDEIERLSTIRFTPKDDINEMLEQNNSSHLKEGVSAKELITRPEITYDMMLPYIDAPELSEEQRRRITILIKYAGYIEKAKRQAQKQIKMEEKHIPEDIDYEDVKNLALEAKQKLSEIRPLTIGQASRISGINPADISVLLIYLKQKYNGE